MTWISPADLDPEVRELCEVINTLPGVVTTESCCGHGKQPFRIWLHVEDPECLLPLLWAMAGCHSGQYGWTVHVYTDCAASVVTWMLQGPAGAYGAASVIAGVLRDEIEESAARGTGDNSMAADDPLETAKTECPSCGMQVPMMVNDAWCCSHCGRLVPSPGDTGSAQEPTAEDPLTTALDAIGQREQAATKGPWWSDDSERSWRLHGVAALLPMPPEFGPGDQVVGRQILKAPKHSTPYAEYWPDEADAAFIVAARTDIPRLLAAFRLLLGYHAAYMTAEEHAALTAELTGEEPDHG